MPRHHKPKKPPAIQSAPSNEELDRKSKHLRDAAHRWMHENQSGGSSGWRGERGVWEIRIWDQNPTRTYIVEVKEDGSSAFLKCGDRTATVRTPRALLAALIKMQRATRPGATPMNTKEPTAVTKQPHPYDWTHQRPAKAGLTWMADDAEPEKVALVEGGQYMHLLTGDWHALSPRARFAPVLHPDEAGRLYHYGQQQFRRAEAAERRVAELEARFAAK